MKDSKDAAEAAEKIMQLCVARDQGGAGAPSPALSKSGPVSAMSGRKTSAMKKEVPKTWKSLPHIELHVPINQAHLKILVDQDRIGHI
uniref:Uncharacterized protein n=1 Tax=Oryza brachyantha TaxID=4533 RepID=J3MXA4_ORYBR